MLATDGAPPALLDQFVEGGALGCKVVSGPQWRRRALDVVPVISDLRRSHYEPAAKEPATREAPSRQPSLQDLVLSCFA
jgi:hypothetical protein